MVVTNSTIMAFNIVTALQERMGFEPFEKIDPNYKSDKAALTRTPGHYAQAAAMVVLAAMYKSGTDPEGAWRLEKPDYNNLLTVIFQGRQEAISREIEYYRDDSERQDNLAFMRRIAIAAIGLLHQQLPSKDSDSKEIQHIMSAQRHNILTYLPPELQTGRNLGDNSMDDRTNKMEGPVSGLMHFFENVFAEKE